MGSIPANGSSRSQNKGEITRGGGVSTRRRPPPAKDYPLVPSTGEIRISTSSSRSRSSRSPSDRDVSSRKARIFSRTVSFRKTDGSWGREPSPILAPRRIGRRGGAPPLGGGITRL